MLHVLRAAAVDMFPHTDKFELVVLWERYDETKWRRIMEGTPILFYKLLIASGHLVMSVSAEPFMDRTRIPRAESNSETDDSLLNY